MFPGDTAPCTRPASCHSANAPNRPSSHVRNNRCETGVLKANDPATGEGGDAYADYSRTYTAAESVD